MGCKIVGIGGFALWCLIGGMRFAREGNNAAPGVSSNRSVDDGAERSQSRVQCILYCAAN
jgi:hypothetical protein